MPFAFIQLICVSNVFVSDDVYVSNVTVSGVAIVFVLNTKVNRRGAYDDTDFAADDIDTSRLDANDVVAAPMVVIVPMILDSNEGWVVVLQFYSTVVNTNDASCGGSSCVLGNCVICCCIGVSHYCCCDSVDGCIHHFVNGYCCTCKIHFFIVIYICVVHVCCVVICHCVGCQLSGGICCCVAHHHVVTLCIDYCVDVCCCFHFTAVMVAGVHAVATIAVAAADVAAAKYWISY